MQDSKTPMVTALISIAVNIALSYFFSKTLGVGGLALASALASTLNALLNFILMNRRIKGIFSRQDGLDILKIVISVLIMSAVVFGTYYLISPLFAGQFIGRIISLGVPVLAGAVVYFLLCYLLRVTEMQIMVDTFIKRKR